ncbi:hypothetical protein [Rhodoferax sp.]|uniref:hypothetical protein n=1 Tax=Rhodoferax sp. TaxID=50421 RepID=UPI0028518DAA|nr:hypothetical protein [Rhodoferax sp.]MDR3370696.1 hypothetical protein [Rhodoferax sp.]
MKPHNTNPIMIDQGRNTCSPEELAVLEKLGLEVSQMTPWNPSKKGRVELALQVAEREVIARKGNV